MLQVLHVIPTLDPKAGGPVNAIEGLSSALANLGVKVEILTTYRQGDSESVVDHLKQCGVRITRVGPVLGPTGYHPNLKKAALQAVQRNDVVHIHALWEDIQHHAARASQKLNKPYIIRPCGMLDPWSLGQSKLRKKLFMALRVRRNLNSAHALHFTAQSEHELTKPLSLKAPAIIESNGLNLTEFENLPDKDRFLKICPELGSKPYILFLSRVHPKKGLDLLIPAFAQVVPEEYRLVIAGPGDEAYVAYIKELVKEHGIQDRVIFPGMLTGQSKLAALAEAEGFVLPSYQENFGIAVIESLAAGTPVLISDQVNIWLTIKQAGVGLVCQTEIASVATSLNRLIVNHPIADPESCRHFVREHYDWRVIAERWVQRLEDIHQSVSSSTLTKR